MSFLFISFSFLIFCLCQTISVSVSVLTLSCIAQDRWYAICHPLKFKSTAKRARRSIILIWLVSCVIMIPQAVVMECTSLLPDLLPELTNKTVLFTVCDEHWGGERAVTQMFTVTGIKSGLIVCIQWNSCSIVKWVQKQLKWNNSI